MSSSAKLFSGVPRSDLESELESLRLRFETTVELLISTLLERDAYLRQLTEVQARCTELLTVDRVLAKELRPLAERIVEARKKHPEGCFLENLYSERLEVDEAVRFEGQARVDSELLDEATCTIRIINGGDRQ